MDKEQFVAQVSEYIRRPEQHKSYYTPALVEQALDMLFDSSQHEDVRTLMDQIEMSSQNSERLQLAALVDSKGDIDKLKYNVQLANLDYRDLLMAFYM